MSTVSFLIALPLLVIFSYVFDLIAKQTKFPAVILLMGTGIVARLVAGFYGQDQFVFLDDLIPVLGTIGLILIVLVNIIVNKNTSHYFTFKLFEYLYFTFQHHWCCYVF